MSERRDRQEMEGYEVGGLEALSITHIVGTLQTDFDKCITLIDAFMQSNFGFDRGHFFHSLEDHLKEIYSHLELLDSLSKELREGCARNSLRKLRDRIGLVLSLQNMGIFSFEEVLLTRALYNQIETRLRILAGPGNREVWEGPVPSNNRSIEGDQS